MHSENFLCGVVEGFYGRPWNADQRHQLFARMHSWGLNTYLHAPKDDLKHRLLWRQPYDERELAELKALIEGCQRMGIRFIHALAPGLDPEFSRPAGLRALHAKATQLAALGCANFALLFDDIVAMEPTGPLGLSAAVAGEQIEVANGLLAFLRSSTPSGRLLFCPTPYCGRMAGSVPDSAYFQAVGHQLEPSIDVLWTGPEIISESITPASIRELAAVIRRKPVLWDNLHANDYDLRRLYLGPYAGRPVALRAELGGVLSNPNCEFEANFIPLRTLAMWAQSSGPWDPEKACEAALLEWLPFFAQTGAGGQRIEMPVRELRWLSDCFHLPFRHGELAATLLADYQQLLHTPPSGWAEGFTRCLEAAAAIDSLFSHLTALAHRELSYALYRHVWELREEAHLMLSYLNWRQANPGPGEIFRSAEHRPKTYRGGLVAELQRLLPMRPTGQFVAQALGCPNLPPPPDRSPTD